MFNTTLDVRVDPSTVFGFLNLFIVGTSLGNSPAYTNPLALALITSLMKSSLREILVSEDMPPLSQ